LPRVGGKEKKHLYEKGSKSRSPQPEKRKKGWRYFGQMGVHEKVGKKGKFIYLSHKNKKGTHEKFSKEGIERENRKKSLFRLGGRVCGGKGGHFYKGRSAGVGGKRRIL